MDGSNKYGNLVYDKEDVCNQQRNDSNFKLPARWVVFWNENKPALPCHKRRIKTTWVEDLLLIIF
jgi:hypothetical protein